MQQLGHPTIRLITLGGLMVERPGVGAEAPPVQQRQALLLVLLAALGRDGGVSRERLIGFFWPDRPAERARNLLDQALSAARRAFGADVIVSSRTTVSLNPAVIAYDVAALDLAATRGEWDAVVDGYTGPFLDGVATARTPVFAKWAAAERGRCAALYATALESLAVSADRAATGGGGARWRALLAHDPLSVRAVLGCMRSAAALGERADALRLAEEYAARVRGEFGIDPDPTVEALAAMLRTPPRGATHALRSAARPGDGPERAAIAPGPIDASRGGAAVPPPAPASLARPRRRPFARAVGWLQGIAAAAIVLLATAALVAGARTRASAVRPVSLSAPAPVAPRIAEAHGVVLTTEPSPAEARLALASDAMRAHEWDRADSEFRVLIDAAPADPVPRARYATMLAERGRLADGESEARRALAFDRRSGAASDALARILFWERRYPEADAMAHAALLSDPTAVPARTLIGEIAVADGRVRDGVASLVAALSIGRDTAAVLPALAYAYAAMGARDRATELLDRLLDGVARGTVSPASVALVYVGLGSRDDAFRWLDRAARAGDPALDPLLPSPLLASIAADPRFVALERQARVVPP